MTQTRKSKNKRITLLLLCALLLPIAGFLVAVDVEETQASPEGALLAWIVLTALGLGSLQLAHVIAVRTYAFKAIGPISLLSSFIFVGMFGWIANGAWYKYYFFSGYVHPEYIVHQDSNHPNQFLFNGALLDGAANTLIRKIMSSTNVDWSQAIAIELHSDGGSPQEAMLMADFIEHYDVRVEIVGKCVSACTLVLLASRERYIHPKAWIGFHASYVERENKEISYNEPHLEFFNELIEKQLEGTGASLSFRDRAKVQDSMGGFYPSYDELVDEGVANQTHRLYLPANDAPYYL